MTGELGLPVMQIVSLFEPHEVAAPWSTREHIQGPERWGRRRMQEEQEEGWMSIKRLKALTTPVMLRLMKQTSHSTRWR